MQLLIGPDGRVWQPYSHTFLKYIGYFGGDVNIAAYAVRNLGFALLQLRPGYARVSVRPENFPGPCLDKLMMLILEHEDDCPRIVVERAGLAPAPLEMIGNVNDALARLCALQKGNIEQKGGFRPSIVDLDLARLDNPKRHQLKIAFSVWKAAKGRTTTGEAARMLSDPILGKGTTVWMPGKDRCIVQGWPKTYDSFDKSGQHENVGRDLTELPDADYVMPTTQAYFAVARAQIPRLELIEAMITLTDGTRLWTRYERLLLSWRTHSSDNYVSSVPLVRMIRRC